ncbi:bifunctional ADP-dependent NAD(P)H-hydrate dehydratase/NAD(P)H-hydrate epimerase [Microlunatus speluncae]|uniref:bifunctional ADP-dependent NAD(P)H-hydrate dehydratase/NAD(P)H-hydrate epimerase n=1 Tax=Microlunatus speluncae TaxID=2594267 RepID=UPI00126608AF|nr:bifunctional ADP-dependent NAD(P)H-hydrate dehydratase/NAD(P)H-hydrate epimerase [Microlunatus speluncae]
MEQRAYRTATVREVEDAEIARIGAEPLMRRAAAGVAAVARRELIKLRDRAYGGSVLILVGGGNNGGDALYAGAGLARRGVRVLAVRCLGTPHPAGLAALESAGGRLVGLEDQILAGSDQRWDLVIDGILGIGGRPGLPAPVAELAGRLTGAGVPVIAVDLPSGHDTDTGAAGDWAIQARHTVTFGAPKPCHLIEPGRSASGEVTVIDIGLDFRSARPELSALDVAGLAALWPYPGRLVDKYARGVVGLDTGSDRYPGAGLLSTLGAVYSGAGMIRYLGQDKPTELIAAQLPNVVFAPGRVQAHVFGSGWGRREGGERLIRDALDAGTPAVVDADGLRCLPDRLPSSWLLTPHAGELARLLEVDRAEVEADPIRAVRAGADRTGATVLLKGATQLVASPDVTPVLVAVPGPSWTAQAGSGDVLAGIAGTLLAAGQPAFRAGQLAASLQAYTATRHPGPLPPQDLARHLPETIAHLADPSVMHDLSRRVGAEVTARR